MKIATIGAICVSLVGCAATGGDDGGSSPQAQEELDSTADTNADVALGKFSAAARVAPAAVRLDAARTPAFSSQIQAQPADEESVSASFVPNRNRELEAFRARIGGTR